jgi:DNA recombination protein RmuC
MSVGLVILIAVVTLILGMTFGWLYAGRDATKAKETADNLRLQLDGVVAERNEARDQIGPLSAEVARLNAEAAHFDQRMKDLAANRDELITQFREIGDKLLRKAHEDFLERADQRISKADQQSEAKLKALLQPVELTLKRYEEGLQRVEGERKHSYGELRSLLSELKGDQRQVRDETRNLVNALRTAPKTRGKWGEQSLRNVLTQAGLVEGVDFEMEVSVTTDDGRLRPDVVVNLPSERKLIIDAKCSLNAYLDSCEEIDDEKRDDCLKAHVASIRTHVQQLSSKAYWAQFGDAADYVIMYIPGEHFLTAALDQDAKDKDRKQPLWDWALERRVLLATPINLVAIARTVASVWRQEKLAAEAAKIAELGRELHSRLATMAEHIGSVGTNLTRATNAYNKMVGSLESQVLTQARRFEDYGAGSAKEILLPPMIEASPRPLTKLASKPSNDEPPQIAAE